jgi:hypothetical protein
MQNRQPKSPSTSTFTVSVRKRQNRTRHDGRTRVFINRLRKFDIAENRGRDQASCAHRGRPLTAGRWVAESLFLDAMNRVGRIGIPTKRRSMPVRNRCDSIPGFSRHVGIRVVGDDIRRTVQRRITGGFALKVAKLWQVIGF